MSSQDTIRLIMKALATDKRFILGFRDLWQYAQNMPLYLTWLVNKATDFTEEHGKAPKRNLEMILASDSSLDPEDRQELSSLFASLSDEWDSEPPYDTDYLLGKASEYLELERYLDASAELEAAANARDIESARQVLDSLKKPTQSQILIVDPFQDDDLLERAFAEKDESLVELGGDLQQVMGRQLVRDSFVGILGKEKVGKTWFKQALLFGANRKGTNVLFCQLGDLSDTQQWLRFATQISGRNWKPWYNEEILSPICDCWRKQVGKCDKNPGDPIILPRAEEDKSPYPKLLPFTEVGEWYEPCTDLYCRNRINTTWAELIPSCPDLTVEDAKVVRRRFNVLTMGRIKTLFASTKSISISGIREAAQHLYEMSGWKAGMVIIDYMDNLAPEKGGKDFRLQEGEKWEQARAWSQDGYGDGEKICVVGGTQAPKKTRRSRLLTDEDMAENKLKKAHVTAFFGLNRDSHDKRKGWLRVNELVIREEDYDMDSELAVMQLIQRGRPNIGSFWLRQRRD